MTASARRPEGRSPSRQPRQAAPVRKGGGTPASTGKLFLRYAARQAGSRIGTFVLRNPLALGSGTAFLVAFSFVSANAIWGQSQSHAGAFFHTRALPSGWSGEATTTGAIGPAAPRPEPDPTLRRVQAELGRMGLYDGALDGLPGPGTRKAISAFQARNGMKVSGELDGALLGMLEKQAAAAQARDGDAAEASPAGSMAADAGSSNLTAKVQAGLKAFGIDGIAVDGVMGTRTRAGIREFQKMFGLSETGEPDETLLAKMRETGLTD